MAEYAADHSPPPGQLSGLALAGFVLSFVVPPVALVLSAVGHRECTQPPYAAGRGFAVAGMVISGLFMSLGLLMCAL